MSSKGAYSSCYTSFFSKLAYMYLDGYSIKKFSILCCFCIKDFHIFNQWKHLLEKWFYTVSYVVTWRQLPQGRLPGGGSASTLVDTILNTHCQVCILCRAPICAPYRNSQLLLHMDIFRITFDHKQPIFCSKRLTRIDPPKKHWKYIADDEAIRSNKKCWPTSP